MYRDPITVSIDSLELPVTLLRPTRPLQPIRFKLLYDTTIISPNGKVLAAIQKGFVSDGASTPWYFRGLAPPLGMYLMAAVVHDYHCKRASDLKDWKIRQKADRLFQKHLRWCGVGQPRSRVMSSSVIAHGRIQKLKGLYK